MGDLRLGQKLVNYFRFGPNKIKEENIWRRITTMEDDEFQRILDVNIFAPPNSNLRIANYQKLLNVQHYDILKRGYEEATKFVDNLPGGGNMTYHKKKKRKKKK